MTIGEQIRRLRDAANLSREQLATAAGINRSQLARIETGETRRPQKGTLERLAKALGVTFEDLNPDSSVQPKIASELRIGAAHCLWSAPFVALLEGEARGVTVSTFAEEDSTEGSLSLHPVHQAPSSVLYGQAIRHGPSFGDAVYANANKGVFPYTVQGLARSLLSDEFDCIVGAREVLSTYEGRLIPCANISSFFGGCTILAARVIEDESSAELGIARRSSFHQFISHLEKSQSLPVIGARGTVAERQIAYLYEARKVRQIGARERWAKTFVNLSNWSETVRTAKKCLEENRCFLFVAWQPQIAWLEDILTSEVNLQLEFSEIDLIALLDEEHRGHPHLTYDIYFNAGKNGLDRWIQDEVFWELMRSVSTTIRQIENATASDSSLINFLAGYFGMDPDVCLRSLEKLSFNVTYYPEWVQELRKSYE